MSIKYVILGYLSWQPRTGYDLKKVIAESETLPWSANNNQIYRALVELLESDWVTKTIHDQVGAPDRHVYTVTDAGKKALSIWVKSVPGLPTPKKPFLNQLFWADILQAEDIDQLLEVYQEVVADKLFLVRVQADRRPHWPDRSEREKKIWDMIYKNWINQYEAELGWIRGVRKDLKNMAPIKTWS